MFGVRPALGRTFARDEDQRGKEKVTVLTHRLWLNVFGGDAGIVGRTILLNGEPYTVIGVLPGNSEFDRRAAELWVPLAFPPNPARDYHYLSAVARLKRGVTLEQAQAEMSAIAGRIAALYPAIKKDWGATVDKYLDRIVGDQTRLSLTVLMGAVIAVLLIGCANLANLLMARATLRSREIALRVALGAGRGRVIRMLLTESLLLSTLGAIVGVALRLRPAAVDPEPAAAVLLPAPRRTSAWTAACCSSSRRSPIFTSIAFGLMPALQASRGSAAEALKEGGRAQLRRTPRHPRASRLRRGAGRGRVHPAAGAGLLIRSFQRVMNVDIGYDGEGIVAAYLPLAMEREPEPLALTQYIQQLLDEVRAVPGMRDAAVTTGIPLRGWGDGMPFRLPAKPDEIVGTGFKIVTPGYFQTLGLRLDRRPPARRAATPPARRRWSSSTVVRAALLPRQDRRSASASWSRRSCRRGAASGRRLSWEIVGVVADEKGRGLESATDVGAYASFAQSPVVGLGLVARGAAIRAR